MNRNPSGLRAVLGSALLSAERAVRRARWAVAPPRRMSVAPPPVMPSSPPSREQVTTRGPRVDVSTSHPEIGITVELIVSLNAQAERGLPWRLYDLYDGVRRFDGHLRGLVEARNMPVVGKSWVLLPGADDDASRRAAADLEIRFRRAGGDAWIRHHQNSAFYGPAVSESIWDVVDGLIAPSRFVHVPPRRLASPTFLEPDEIGIVNGPMISLTISPTISNAVRGNVVPLSEHPGRFSCTVYEEGNPWVAGLYNTAMWWAAFKRWAWRDWQVFAEMFGLPIRVGYYQEGASEASRKALDDAIEAVGTDGYAVLSDLCELVVQNNARSGDAKGVYDAQITVCEQQMSKLILGGTLTTDAGGNGSYAQASTHGLHGFNRALGDARAVSATFERDIATPFVLWNGYGGRAAPPKMKLQIERETSLTDRANHISTLATALPTFEFDEEQIREDFALRKPAPGAGIKNGGADAKGKPSPAGGTDA